MPIYESFSQAVGDISGVDSWSRTSGGVIVGGPSLVRNGLSCSGKMAVVGASTVYTKSFTAHTLADGGSIYAGALFCVPSAASLPNNTNDFRITVGITNGGGSASVSAIRFGLYNDSGTIKVRAGKGNAVSDAVVYALFNTVTPGTPVHIVVRATRTGANIVYSVAVNPPSTESAATWQNVATATTASGTTTTDNVFIASSSSVTNCWLDEIRVGAWSDVWVAGDAVHYADTVILAGQSNAQGVGDANNLSASLKNTHLAGVYLWNATNARTELMRPGPDASSNLAASGTDKFGPEVYIGQQLKTLRNRDVWIFKHAESGSALCLPVTSPETHHWSLDYATAISSAAFEVYRLFSTVQWPAFVADVAARGYTLRILGTCWMQGESDANDGYPDRAPPYATELARLIAAVRTLTSQSLMPFIVGRISDNIAALALYDTGGPIVRAAQASVVASTSKAYLVDTDSYGMNVDNIHYSSAGQTSLGTAFAEAIQQLNITARGAYGIGVGSVVSSAAYSAVSSATNSAT